VNAITHLLDEHQVIMTEFAALRAAVRDLDARGEAALAEAQPVLGRIGRLMETQLALHARKEDEVLFPALEAIFGTEGTPTAVMRQEHKDIHAQGELLRQTLHELNAVEHPRIEAGGAQLRAMASGGASARVVSATAREILNLLDLHFGKEEQILFPMAENLLDADQLDALGRECECLAA
jgi:hemerythrin-like domain-containing protein